ncbi:hypothetical protein IQ273_02375 [Nodosilinea sp. LEGE 07298]|uniref:hypothetical protein n=1 Tax=Nodosilinea sp. LEGE 07298 TaxID=2777970 RepID=UPI00187FB78F|nr:hypothetical protein [Nodosilinea sp. LEGE 07298]MBE9108268.1 hypothetical protein [Nodosilinea sp. LEGE 07298]
MARQVRLNYIYASATTWERFDLACDQLGWAKKSLVQQCLHEFFHQHHAFYQGAAIADAAARQMDEAEYYRTLRDKSEDDLRRYTLERPGFEVTPLDPVPFNPSGTDIQRTYNVITISNYNAVLLKVARIVDTGPMVQLVSRIIEQHFEAYWEKNYFPQIERDMNCSFR